MKNNKYLVIVRFNSKIFKNLIVPEGTILENHFGILYYNKKPVLYIEDSKGVTERLR